jgi:hypothetical protein
VDEQPPERVWSQLDDATLLEYLRHALGHHEQPPESVVDLAKASLGLRHLDSELATLSADSLTDTAGPRVRAAHTARMVSFESTDLALELESAPTGSSWRIVGQLEPPTRARIHLLRPGRPDAVPAESAVDTDVLGRFALNAAGPGPLSLLCRRPGKPDVVTAWILLR